MIRERLLDLARRVRELDPDQLARQEFEHRRAEVVASLRCLAAAARDEADPEHTGVKQDGGTTKPAAIRAGVKQGRSNGRARALTLSADPSGHLP